MTRKSEILAQVSNIPSLPSVVVKLRRFLSDPDYNFDELAKVIEYDPGLTANILQLANSAYFGWSGTIKSVKDAVVRLGVNRIFQMVLCMSVAPLVRKPVKGYDLDSDALWEHSIAVAICAEQLAEMLKLKNVEASFTAGLLHDIGKIVMGTFVEVDDDPIKEIVEKDKLAFNEAERMVLGIDHSEVGGLLLENWSLPSDVISSVRWHHEPGKAEVDHQTLVDLIHVADVLCMNVGWGAGGDGMQYRLDEAASRRLGVKAETAEEVILRVISAIDELRGLFSSSMESEPNSAQHSHR